MHIASTTRKKCNYSLLWSIQCRGTPTFNNHPLYPQSVNNYLGNNTRYTIRSMEYILNWQLASMQQTSGLQFRHQVTNCYACIITKKSSYFRPINKRLQSIFAKRFYAVKSRVLTLPILVDFAVCKHLTLPQVTPTDRRHWLANGCRFYTTSSTTFPPSR